MTVAQPTPFWKYWHYLWSAVVVGALLLNVIWPPYPYYRLFALALVAFPVAAAAILTNRPANRVGRVLAAVSVAAGVVFIFGWAVWTWKGATWSPYVEAMMAAALPVVFWGAISLTYLFPTGRVARPFRPVFIVFTAVLGLMSLLAPFDPGPMELTKRVNPIGGPSWIGSLYEIALFVLVPGLIGGVLAAIARFRTSGREVRTQLKWFIAALVAVVGLGVVLALVPEGLPSPYEQIASLVVVVGFWAIPAAIVVAVTRYHLYEIDRLVSRTLAYAIVVGLVAATFFGAIALISILIPSQNSLAVAGSTLLVATLFNPLRKRLQHAVDRRFNRSAYRAEVVLGQFTAQLQESLTTDQLMQLWTSNAIGYLQPSACGAWVASHPVESSNTEWLRTKRPRQDSNLGHPV